MWLAASTSVKIPFRFSDVKYTSKIRFLPKLFQGLALNPLRDLCEQNFALAIVRGFSGFAGDVLAHEASPLSGLV